MEHDGGVDLKLDSHGFLPKLDSPLHTGLLLQSQHSRCDAFRYGSWSKRRGIVTVAYFEEVSAGSKPGRLGRRKVVGCSQLFRSSWPESRRVPHETKMLWIGGKSASAENGVRRKKQLRKNPMKRWTTRRRPNVSRRRRFSVVFTSKFPHSGSFSSWFSPEGSFQFHATVFMLVPTAGPCVTSSMLCLEMGQSRMVSTGPKIWNMASLMPRREFSTHGRTAAGTSRKY